MIQVAQGRLSKQIAADLGISQITVKVHRSNMRRKMNVRSLSELIRLADKLGLVPETTERYDFAPGISSAESERPARFCELIPL